VNYAGNARAAEEVVAAIRASEGEAHAVQGDVSQAADVKCLFDVPIDRFGRLDMLVNNAGVILTEGEHLQEDHIVEKLKGDSVSHYAEAPVEDS